MRLLKIFFLFVASFCIIGVCVVYNLLFSQSVITNKIEKDSSFINSDAYILYFSNGELHSTCVNGENDSVLGKYVTSYSFNKDYTKVVFVENNSENEKILSIIDVMTNTPLLKKQISESVNSTPIFSPDSNKLLYKTNIGDIEYLHVLDIKNNNDKVVFKTSIKDALQARWVTNSQDVWISLYTIPNVNQSGFNVFYKLSNVFSDGKLDDKITQKEMDINKIENLYNSMTIVTSGSNRLKDYEPFINTDDNKFIYTKENRPLVNYKIRKSVYAKQRISDYDYTSNNKFVVFSFEKNYLYVIDVSSGKIGLLTKNGWTPRFIGTNHSNKYRLPNTQNKFEDIND